MLMPCRRSLAPAGQAGFSIGGWASPPNATGRASPANCLPACRSPGACPASCGVGARPKPYLPTAGSGDGPQAGCLLLTCLPVGRLLFAFCFLLLTTHYSLLITHLSPSFPFSCWFLFYYGLHHHPWFPAPILHGCPGCRGFLVLGDERPAVCSAYCLESCFLS